MIYGQDEISRELEEAMSLGKVDLEFFTFLPFSPYIASWIWIWALAIGSLLSKL
jgi:hypothetical protein